jgi:hypothetical protein
MVNQHLTTGSNLGYYNQTELELFLIFKTETKMRNSSSFLTWRRRRRTRPETRFQIPFIYGVEPEAPQPRYL